MYRFAPLAPFAPLALLFLASCTDADSGGSGGTRRFFLPTGAEARNTVKPRIEIDGDGRIHAVYPAHAIGDAFYATCEADCASPEDVAVVPFETDGTVADAMLAFDPSGRPHVLMSTYLDVYYARCTGNCASPAGWELDVILTHGGEMEISGEAFAITPDGRPRFLMHAYRSFPSGSDDPATYYVSCESDCGSAGSWTPSRIADQVWQESTLRFDADGTARLATVATTDSGDLAAYVECEAGCSDGANWTPIGLYPAYSDRWISEIDPAVAMSFTSAGGPRVLVLGEGEDGVPNLTWLECDSDCTEDASWRGTVMVASDALGAGLDVAVDEEDAVHFVYTENANIRHARCAADDCTPADAPWGITPVELSSDMTPDQVIPYPGCVVAAWFLRDPSIAVGSDGAPRVVYRADDVSGGFPSDPLEPECIAGPDMTLARFAWLTSLNAP